MTGIASTVGSPVGSPVGASVQVGGGSGPVLWKQYTKTAADGWGNSGFYSSQSFSGNGYVSVVVGAMGAPYGRMFGLSTSSPDSNYTTIGFGLNLFYTSLEVYELGTIKATLASPVVGDVLSIHREGTTITYRKNGSVLYTSLLSSSGSLIFDAALFNGSILNPRMSDNGSDSFSITAAGLLAVDIENVEPIA